MMKIFCMAILFAMAACGQQASPEGRSIIRDEQIRSEINLLKQQNKALLDSISLISQEVKALKEK